MKLNRQWIHVQIDIDDYIKGKELGVKWSVLGRKLFKQYFSIDKDDSVDEINVKKDLETTKEEAERINNKLSELSMKLSIINEQKKKEIQKRIDAEMRINQGMNESGINPLDQ